MSCINADPNVFTYTTASRHRRKGETWKRVPNSIGIKWEPYTWIGSWDNGKESGWFKIISGPAKHKHRGNSYDYKSELVLDAAKIGIFSDTKDPVIGYLYHNDAEDLGERSLFSVDLASPYVDCSETSQINLPNKFNKKSANKFTNFNPSADTLGIDTDSFRIDRSATFATGKNKKKVMKLAKKDFDFLYDEKKGGLYFNENGAEKGFGDGGIIAILKGAPDLTSGNLEFI